MGRKTPVKQKVVRKRTRERVVLEGSPVRSAQRPNAGAHVYAAYTALACMGERVTEYWVAGICGDVWRIVFTGPRTVYPETPYVGVAQLTLKALEVMGLECEYHAMARPGDELARIIGLLREGKPVIVKGFMKPDRWGVLVGFNRRRRKLFYRDCVLEDGPVELDESAFLARPPAALVYILSAGGRPTRKEMLLQSLKNAVEWSRNGLQQFDSSCTQLYYSGFTAYQHWISWLNNPGSKMATEQEASTYARVVAETAYARGLAPPFLRQGARIIRKAPKEIIRSAAEAYDEVADCFGQLSELFPLDTPTLEPLEEGAQIVQRALAAERLGLGHIKRLLRSLQD